MNINVEERAQHARDLFNSGYNCAQAVAIAYADITKQSPELLATVAAPFGGGLGRLREVCGTVSGMSIIAGFVVPVTNPMDKSAKSRNYQMVQMLAGKFRDSNGSIICRELLGLSPMSNTAVDGDRLATPAKKKPCEVLVEEAARFVGEALAEL